MEVRDSRRLTGRHLLLAGAGAVLDVALGPDDPAEGVAALWRRQLERILAAVGWESSEVVHRIFPRGMSLAFRAPIDALYAATEVNEWAWEAAVAEVEGGSAPDFERSAERLRRTIATEVNPPLVALREAARAHGVQFLSDDDEASVGLGAGSLVWPVNRLPRPESVPWSEVRDVPVAQVTGTNGKSTTVRLLAAMLEAEGRVPGVSSTDWIAVGGELLDTGDYSGPGGARRVLRDRRVESAVLETARGGLLRRGLALERTDAALVTNIAEDHLGEFGVHDLDGLAQCKLVVAGAARHLTLNADDPVLRRQGEPLAVPTTWFSLEAGDVFVEAHVAAGGAVAVLDGDRLLLRDGAAPSVPVVDVGEIPIALGGAARHNVANALAATVVALRLGVALEAVRQGLRAFESTTESNPGRLNLFTIGGVRVVLDFAHNPHGVAALLEMAAALPARRRLLTIGQAGDRDDHSIRELARAAWKARPDRILIKQMNEYRRGRAEGEVAAMLEAELRRLGAGDEHIRRVEGETAAARAALEWAEPGDLVLLIVHSGRAAVTELLEAARREEGAHET